MKRALVAVVLLPLACAAQEDPDRASTPPRVGFHAQSTWIWQRKPAFSASYTGPNSLRPQAEHADSFTATLDAGVRLWSGAQFHLNPEAARGVPLSNLTGAGSLSNGELARGSSTEVRTYRARGFLQQRIDLDGERETIAPGFNEMGGSASQQRWTFTVGNFALLDFFDPNPYAKDPRSQFMNWAFMAPGAWDYAADARGYTRGAVAEYRSPTWTFRIARVMQPIESNGTRLDADLRRQHGDQLELERPLPWSAPGGPLVARLLVFRNRVRGGAFDEAIAAAPAGSAPTVASVRRLNTKTGWGFTLQAPLSEDEGLFLRTSRSDGRVETYAFTEIDRQLAVGSQFTGRRWGRAEDRWGVAYAINGLSPQHREYLARGGLGFFLGDGRLNYGTERVLEAYYRWALPTVHAGSEEFASHLSAGFQHLANPGYNRDRGPVRTFAVRWHGEF